MGSKMLIQHFPRNERLARNEYLHGVFSLPNHYVVSRLDAAASLLQKSM